jgi:hypothetical protein
VELKETLRPILGDKEGHGDRVLERLLIRLQQSPRCDDATREDIVRVRAFVDAAPPRKQRGNGKALESRGR